MLVVSRRIGEEILVPQFGIVFRILEVRGNKVRVGITAPADIRVQRRELYDRIQRGQATDHANPIPAETAVLDLGAALNGSGSIS